MVLIINHIVCLQTFRAHPEEVRQSGRGGGGGGEGGGRSRGSLQVKQPMAIKLRTRFSSTCKYVIKNLLLKI